MCAIINHTVDLTRGVCVLQVKYVQARDAGLYECQVGTEPKMSHFVQLNVVGKYHYPLPTSIE